MTHSVQRIELASPKFSKPEQGTYEHKVQKVIRKCHGQGQTKGDLNSSQ